MKRQYWFWVMFLICSVLVSCGKNQVQPVNTDSPIAAETNLLLKAEVMGELAVVTGDYLLTNSKSETITGALIIEDFAVALIEDIAATEWEVEISLYDITGQRVATGYTFIEVLAGETTELVVPLTRCDLVGTIQGYARLLNQTMHTGVTVEICNPIGEEVAKIRTNTDATGFFSLESIPVDKISKRSSYLCMAYPESVTEKRYSSDTMLVEVVGGEQTRLNFEFCLRYSAVELLILQNMNPWWQNSLLEMLNQFSIPYQIHNSGDWSEIELSSNQVVWIVNDQDTLFYQTYVANYDKFEKFVADGGTLIFGAAQGYNFGSLDAVGGVLPGEVGVEFCDSRVNLNLSLNHPLMKGVPEMITGVSASTNFFSNLPENHVILAQNSKEAPTLVEYKYKSGRVIAIGMPLELNWANDEDGKNILSNLITYTFDLFLTDMCK